MEAKELTAHQRFLLRFLKENPDYKFTGGEMREMNVMSASYNLVKSAGNLQWEFTKEGLELMKTNKPLHAAVSFI